jgi:hypothetical protein
MTRANTAKRSHVTCTAGKDAVRYFEAASEQEKKRRAAIT